MTPPADPRPLVEMIERHAGIFGWSRSSCEVVLTLARQSWTGASPLLALRGLEPQTADNTIRSRFERAGLPSPRRLWDGFRTWWLLAARREGYSMLQLSMVLNFSSQNGMNRWLRLQRHTDGRAFRPKHFAATDPEAWLGTLYADYLECDNPGWRDFYFARARGTVTVLTAGGIQ